MPDPIDNNEDIFLPQSDRLGILSPEEYEMLWGVPRFSPCIDKPKYEWNGELIEMCMHASAPEAVDRNSDDSLDLIVDIEDGNLVWVPRTSPCWS